MPIADRELAFTELAPDDLTARLSAQRTGMCGLFSGDRHDRRLHSQTFRWL